jgi:Flp pilus assembly pilin Flp
MIRVARTLARRLLVEDAGQDLIEYAMLTMIVSIGSLLIFDSIRNKMGDAYEQWGTDIQDNWVPPPPL